MYLNYDLEFKIDTKSLNKFEQFFISQPKVNVVEYPLRVCKNTMCIL